MDRERGIVKKQVGRRGMGEGGRLKTGKNVRKSLMEDPIVNDCIIAADTACFIRRISAAAN